MTNTIVNNEFLGGSLIVKESTAGLTTSLLINHSDDTNSASHSLVKLETGGANAGDSFISLYNSVTSFSYGLDNSDSDSFVMAESGALGTTNAALCNTDGYWTYPSNSAFSVNINDVNVNDVTGDDTTYRVLFNTSRFNIGSDYDPVTNYQYVCPVSGIYMFTGQMYLTGGECTYAVIHFERNGSCFCENLTGNSLNNNDQAASVSCIYSCDAGDIIKMSLRAGWTIKTYDLYGPSSITFFMGALVS